MPLIRHIAGVPTDTEQRCVRCCEVIVRQDGPKVVILDSCGREIAKHNPQPFTRGSQVLEEGSRFYSVGENERWAHDCKPVDLSAVIAE